MKAFLINSVVTFAFLAILILSAGRLDYGPAWIYAAIGMATNLLMRLALRGRPDLARERANPGAGAEGWDKRLLGFAFLLNVTMLIVAGLDSGRFGWTPAAAWGWPVAGALLIVAGSALFVVALNENPFFSAVVRVQRDRGHKVCDSGPYRIVRHPGNAGLILGVLGFPALFASAWSAIPALLLAALMVARTALEDAALARELPGYRDYRRATRYRLAPGVW